MKIVNFEETVPMMESEDYKERFKAEYYQTRIRYQKLCGMLNDWENGKLNFEPTCPKAVLERQMQIMNEYLRIMFERAKWEGIELE